MQSSHFCGEKTVESQENHGVAGFISANLSHVQQQAFVIYQHLITATHV